MDPLGKSLIQAYSVAHIDSQKLRAKSSQACCALRKECVSIKTDLMKIMENESCSTLSLMNGSFAKLKTISSKRSLKKEDVLRAVSSLAAVSGGGAENNPIEACVSRINNERITKKKLHRD